MKLDKQDIAILKALQQDASVSSTELAERVGLSQSPCWRRVNQLGDGRHRLHPAGRHSHRGGIQQLRAGQARTDPGRAVDRLAYRDRRNQEHDRAATRPHLARGLQARVRH
ncbi:MAG: AsnC family transcriptional regulator [Gammaproteobacteria bacterium]|nr:AsnC family transcriptional regulator [Gammaproteobacteria bacterium]